MEISHRRKQAGASYHRIRRTLVNHHIPLRLRLRLFVAIVIPTMLYGLGVHVTSAHRRRGIDATRRRMIRNIVGWRRIEDEHWEITMRRMKQRVQDVTQLHFVIPWEQQLSMSQWRYDMRLASSPENTPWRRLANWNPQEMHDPQLAQIPHRSVGRPRMKWDDRLKSFALIHFPHSDDWITAMRNHRTELASMRDVFVASRLFPIRARLRAGSTDSIGTLPCHCHESHADRQIGMTEEHLLAYTTEVATHESGSTIDLTIAPEDETYHVKTLEEDIAGSDHRMVTTTLAHRMNRSYRTSVGRIYWANPYRWDAITEEMVSQLDVLHHGIQQATNLPFNRIPGG